MVASYHLCNGRLSVGVINCTRMYQVKKKCPNLLIRANLMGYILLSRKWSHNSHKVWQRGQNFTALYTTNMSTALSNVSAAAIQAVNLQESKIMRPGRYDTIYLSLSLPGHGVQTTMDCSFFAPFPIINHLAGKGYPFSQASVLADC